MTTLEAEARYLADHLSSVSGRKPVIFNPHSKELNELPIIYGFNNGGGRNFLHAVLVSQDGEFLGDHLCSHEGYMRHDLGILEGSRLDRHERFKESYPDGYRMEFVSREDVSSHEGLQAAFSKCDERKKEEDI